MMMGFAVNYTIRKGSVSNGKWEEHPRALMSREGLTFLLTHPRRYVVNTAVSVIVDQFRENWQPDQYEDQLEISSAFLESK